MYLVSELSKDAFIEAVAEFDLTPAQARNFITMDEPVPMRDLAERWACDASNVTGIVDGLERQGLIERVPGKDRRVRMITVTEHGRLVQTRLRRHVETAPFPTDVLSEDEKAELVRLLTKVADAHGV